MLFLNRRFSLLVLFLALPLLFLPKINLFIIDKEQTAGLRIDDFVLLFLSVILLWSHAISKESLYKVEGWILLLTGFSFFSFLINRFLVSEGILPMDAKIFYAFRLLEYFVFFYVGALAARYLPSNAIIVFFFLCNLLLMTLQKFDLVGGIISSGYHSDVSGRVQGIASFPSEMGLLLNLLFCFLAFDKAIKKDLIQFFYSPFIRFLIDQFYLYALFCLFGIFIIFTGNRISIAALLASFLFRLKQDLSLRSLGNYFSMLLLIPVAFIAIIFVIKQTSGVYERSASLFSWKNIDLFTLVWDKIDPEQFPAGDDIYASSKVDMSWWIRIHKWLFMSKSYLEHPENYLQGLGPGYAGPALDGGILRIITEYGIIGAFLFWKFFGTLYRMNAQTKWMVISLFINMIFFDAYLAYKSMSFLLFACGIVFANLRQKQDKKQIHPTQQIEFENI